MNDDDQSIGAFPPLGEGDSDSIGDKVLLLKCYNDIPLPFAGDHQQSLKLASSIKSEMQAFAYYVDNYQIPGEIKQGSLRLGFDEYHHPELLITLNMNSNERTLLSATDEIFFGSRGFAEVAILLDQTTQRYYWEGTANEWSAALRDSRGHGAYKTISSQLSYGDTSTAASKWLSKLKKIADGRILGGKDQKIMVGKRRGWKIWAPVEDDDGDGDEPF